MPADAVISTPCLLLRPWREEDLEPFAAMNADPRVMQFLPKALTRAESEAVIERNRRRIERHGFGVWSIEAPAVAPFVGRVGMSVFEADVPFAPCVEIGWRLAFDHWGKGYATEAARAALDFGFATLALHEIVAFTVPANVRSRAVMERLGMTRDPADDFDHPDIPPGHPLQRQVLYRLRRPE